MLKEPNDTGTIDNVIEECDDIRDMVDLIASRRILINHLGYNISITDDEVCCLRVSDSKSGRTAGYLVCEAL